MTPQPGQEYDQPRCCPQAPARAAPDSGQRLTAYEAGPILSGTRLAPLGDSHLHSTHAQGGALRDAFPRHSDPHGGRDGGSSASLFAGMSSEPVVSCLLAEALASSRSRPYEASASSEAIASARYGSWRRTRDRTARLARLKSSLENGFHRRLLNATHRFQRDELTCPPAKRGRQVRGGGRPLESQRRLKPGRICSRPLPSSG